MFFRIIVRTDNQEISKLQSTEPEISETVFRYRNRNALQYFQILRSGYRPYAPNPLRWIDPLGLSGENIFIHYTDKAGLKSIMNAGIIEPNAKGKVYVTDILMKPQDAMRDIFINDQFIIKNQ